MNKKIIKILMIFSLLIFIQAISKTQVLAADCHKNADNYCSYNVLTCGTCGKEYKGAHSSGSTLVSKDSSYHYWKCTNGICSSGVPAAHSKASNSDWKYADNDEHKATCGATGCGATIYESHTSSATSSNSKDAEGHTVKCSTCNSNFKQEHNASGGYVKNCDDTYHYMKCSICKYDEVKREHTRGAYDGYDSTYHYYKCSQTSCYGKLKETHSKGAYSSCDANYHYYKCSQSSCGGEIKNSHFKGSLATTKSPDADYHYYKCIESQCTQYIGEEHVGANGTSGATYVNEQQHKTKCTKCSYEALANHTWEPTGVYIGGYSAGSETHDHQVNCPGCNHTKNETVDNLYEDLDGSEYDKKDDWHKAYCNDCGLASAVDTTEQHTVYWVGGEKDDEYHKCSRCQAIHEFAEATGHPTRGRHYYVFPDETRANVEIPCEVCGSTGVLTLTANGDFTEKLDSLPSKGEYTILGADPAMQEVSINIEEIVFKVNRWPIDIGGKIWDLKNPLTITPYTHGTFYQHVSKLENSINEINNDTGRDILVDANNYFNGNVSDEREAAKIRQSVREYLVKYASYDESYIDEMFMNKSVEEMTEIMSNLKIKLDKTNLSLANIYMFWEGVNVMTVNWSTITKIGSPLAATWLGGDAEFKLKYILYEDEQCSKIYPIDPPEPMAPLYYGLEEGEEIGSGHFEMQDDGLLSTGFSDETKEKREKLTTNAESKETLLFIIGSCGGGVSDPTTPPAYPTPEDINIYANVIIGYRDTNGNVIQPLNSAYAPPPDVTKFLPLWDAGDTTSTSRLSIDSNWTQGAGYRLVGYYIEPQGPASIEGGSSRHRVPSKSMSSVSATRLTTADDLVFNLECKEENELVGIVIYCEPVQITLQHFDNKDIDNTIVTNKNATDIFCSSNDSYSLNSTHYSTKVLASLNKSLWPGYNLLGYDIYDSNGNKIAYKNFDSDSTSKYDMLTANNADAKRYAVITTALLNPNEYYNSSPYAGEVYDNEFNYHLAPGNGEALQYEKLGFGQDKTVKFRYAYAEADVSHVKWEDSGDTLEDKYNKELEYTVYLDGENLIIKSLDTTPGDKILTVDGETFTYDVSDRALAQIWIWEKQYDSDGDELKPKLYRVIAHENYDDDIVLTDGATLQTRTDEDFFNGTFISTTSMTQGNFGKTAVSSDLIIKFVYKEAHSVYVKYVDEDGNTIINPARIIIDDGTPGGEDGEAKIPAPDIVNREFKEYTIPDVPKYEDPTDDGYSSGDKKIDLTELPEENIDMIVVYKKIGTPVINTPTLDETPPYAFIKSNERDPDSSSEAYDADREYNVEVAIPTEEDLYVNIITDEYALRNYFKETNMEQEFNVKLYVTYYAQNDEVFSGENGTVYEVKAGETHIIPINLMDDKSESDFSHTFKYNYHGGAYSQLYIIDTALIHNEALSGDPDDFSGDGVAKVEANYNGNMPRLEYVQGGELTIPVDSTDETSGLKVTWVEGDPLKEGDPIDIGILLPGIVYEQKDIVNNTHIDSCKNGGFDNLIMSVASVSGDDLSVITSSGDEDVYLEARQYPVRTSNDMGINVEEVLSSVDFKYYNKEQVPGVCTRDCLYKNEGFYIGADVQNGFYLTDWMDVIYELKEKGPKAEDMPDEITRKYLDATNKDEINDSNLFYREDNETVTIKKNNIYVYTPIVNRIDLFEDAENRVSTNEDNEAARLDEVLAAISGDNGEKSRVLEIDKEFVLTIPHDGYHPGSGDETTPSDGYGDKNYNYNGIVPEDEGESWVKNARFAKEKLVKFSFDVYLASYADDDGEYKVHELLKANQWYELSEIKDEADKKRGMQSEDYTFVIPAWVKDNESGEITVRIVASNYLGDDYMNDDGVGGNIGVGEEIITTTAAGEERITRYNDEEQYILEEKFNVYIVGSLYGLQVRTSNDPEYEARLNQALTLSRLTSRNRFLPIGQRNQLTAYNNGIKLGYSVYFDLKTKGTASENIEIKPKIYYVSEDGTVRENITLYYEPVEGSSRVEKLTPSVLTTMTMTDTRGDVNNSSFTLELARAIKMLELFNVADGDSDVDNPKEYGELLEIGSLFGTLTLSGDDNRLPYNNLEESWKLYGYNSENAFISDMISHINDGRTTSMLDANLESTLNEYGFTGSVDGKENDLKTFFRSFNGHWYGEFSLPQTTKVISGDNQAYSEKELLKTGYLVVVFDNVVTTAEDGIITGEYLSYDMQPANSQWEKESGGVYDTITLPNGKTAEIRDARGRVDVTLEDGTVTQEDTMQAGAIAIYEVGKTRADDQEIGGTH